MTSTTLTTMTVHKLASISCLNCCSHLVGFLLPSCSLLSVLHTAVIVMFLSHSSNQVSPLLKTLSWLSLMTKIRSSILIMNSNTLLTVSFPTQPSVGSSQMELVVVPGTHHTTGLTTSVVFLSWNFVLFPASFCSRRHSNVTFQRSSILSAAPDSHILITLFLLSCFISLHIECMQLHSVVIVDISLT